MGYEDAICTLNTGICLRFSIVFFFRQQVCFGLPFNIKSIYIVTDRFFPQDFQRNFDRYRLDFDALLQQSEDLDKDHNTGSRYKTEIMKSNLLT